MLGLSGARVSQIESDDANLYTSTVAEVAARFGYRATLTLILWKNQVIQQSNIACCSFFTAGSGL